MSNSNENSINININTNTNINLSNSGSFRASISATDLMNVSSDELFLLVYNIY